MRAHFVGTLIAFSAIAGGCAGQATGAGPSASASAGPSAGAEAGANAGADADANAGANAGAGAGAAGVALANPCAGHVADAYVVPVGLAPMSDDARGDILACAPDSSIAANAVSARLATAGVADASATSGAVTYRVSYRTWRGEGRPGVSSARVYLPTVPRAPVLPVLVAAHRTAGIADLCAPSRRETQDDYLVLPWVARGYAVIATDYAGLGNGGVQGYLDNGDTGRSTLDAARALRKLLVPGALSNKVIVYGHSQGGGSALSAQALAKSYGAGGELVGALAFAPGWDVGVSVDGLRYPDVETRFAGGGPATFTALFAYAYFANHVGPDHAGDAFAPLARPLVEGLIDTTCVSALLYAIPAAVTTVGELFDDTFRATTIACNDGVAGCAEPGKSYVDFLRANVLTADANGAAIAVVQGLEDTTVTPAATSCVLNKLSADGVRAAVCVDDGARHEDVVQRNVGYALAWTESVASGSPLPTCASAALPPCR